MTSPGPLTRDLLQTFDEVRSRTFGRLAGLTDAEYLWEPVPDCMTVHPDADGVFRADLRRRPDGTPEPVTTIAWRIWHIGADCLRGYLDFFPEGGPGDDSGRWPGTAAEGVAALAADWDRFHAAVEALGDAGLTAAMGPRAGDFAAESFLRLGLHALDEVAHHGGEIGLLRDLYLRQGAEPAR